jgi:hypothetical protein
MIIPFHTRAHHSSARKPRVHQASEVWAFTGDFSSFSLLYSIADAPDAPAFFAAQLFDALANHPDKAVRGGELATWADIMPLDSRRWMFYVTAERMMEEILAILNGLVRGTNGWSPVGRVPTLPTGAVPLYEYEKGARYLLLSDVVVGDGEEALAHPFISRTDGGLGLGFGVFPAGYLDENKLYLGTGGGICFKTKSARALRPKKVYCLLSDGKESAPKEEPRDGERRAGLRLVE